MSALIDAIGSPGKASVLSPLANTLVLKAATVGGLHQGIAGRPTFRAEILKTASESWWYWTFDKRDPKKNVISTANLLKFWNATKICFSWNYALSIDCRFRVRKVSMYAAQTSLG